jgi:hypothetical protein
MPLFETGLLELGFGHVLIKAQISRQSSVAGRQRNDALLETNGWETGTGIRFF